MSTDDHDVKNALYGTEALLVPAGSGGETFPAALVRSPDGYWHKGDHWAHRHVSAVLVVKQLHPAFVGARQHTIWEHPNPEQPVPSLPIWRRSTVDSHGAMHFADSARTPMEWFGLTDSWPIGEPSPRRGRS